MTPADRTTSGGRSSSECPYVPLLDADFGLTLTGEGGFPLDDHVDHCAACQERLQRRVDGEEVARRPPKPGKLPNLPGLTIGPELGRGGMGIVLKAWDVRASRHVALKLVAGGLESDRSGWERWLREARSIASVKHPNIVQLHQAEEADGWLCLVLEYVAGGSLADRLRGPLPPRDAVAILRPVAAALAAIHEQGLIHLDLKPSNILLDSPADAPWADARPKVTDFGISRSAADLDGSRTIPAALAGTPPYMAPEQIDPRPEAIGPAADVHALGATLYELLTGRPPFTGASALDILGQVRTREPVAPRHLDPTLPVDLETVTLKCLQKDPSRRYPTAGALADDLDRWIQGRPVQARPASRAEVAWRWCLRNPTVASLSTILAAVLIGGLLAALWASWRLHAGRLEAEANAHAAAAAFVQLLRAGTEIATPQVYDPESFLPRFLPVRASLMALAAASSDGASFAPQLARADCILGEVLIRARRHAEARAYFEECRRLCEQHLRTQPGDLAVRADLVGACNGLDEIAAFFGDESELDAALRAVAEAEELARLAPDAARLDDLSRRRGCLAARLVLRGDRALARSMLEENRRMLDEAPPECEGPEVTAARAFERMNFIRAGVGPDLDPSSQTGAAGGAPPHGPDGLPASAWAEHALRKLQSSARGEAGPGRDVEAAYAFAVRLTILAAEQRRFGRPDLNKATAERTLALGRLVVDREPRSAYAHMTLGEGYIQAYKNAWRDDDPAAVRSNLKLSIAALQQALVLDPDNPMAQRSADQRLRRLKQIEAASRPGDGR